MQNMTKERLNRYIWLNVEIENQTERIERMDTELSSPAVSRLDRMPHSSQIGTKLEVKIARKMELEELRKKNIKKANREAVAIEKAIQMLLLPRDRELMRFKYLEGMTWEETSEKLGISRQWAVTLHERILKELP